MTRLSIGKKIVFACASCVLSGLVVLAILEVFVRVTRPKMDLYEMTGRIAGANPMSRWAVVDAFAAFRAKPGQYAVGKTVNSHGFVSTPEITVAKPEGTVRIVFLGGSSTAGMARRFVADQETWPWRAVEMLRQRVPHEIDFINASASGYSSFESYGLLWSRIRSYQPDIVVMYHGWNEMYYFAMADEIRSWRTLPDGSWSLERSSKPVMIYRPLRIDGLIRWSQALSRIRNRLSKPVSGEVGAATEEPLEPDYNRDGLPIWRANLRLIRQTCDLFGAKLYVAKQATLLVPDLPEELRSKCRYEYHGFDHDAHIDAFTEIYRIIDEEISAERVIDTTPLSGIPEYFDDHIHPTSLGANEIAKIVADSLEPYFAGR